MFPCRSRVSSPAKMLPGLSSSSGSSMGSTSGNTESLIISSSLSAATNLVRSTLSAHAAPGLPIDSRLYMSITSAGISFKPIAAMLRRPLVRAVSRRPCRILAWDLSSLCWLKGSLDRPKSKVSSVGTNEGSDASTGSAAETGCDATRFAALAFAICSRSAAEVFL